MMIQETNVSQLFMAAYKHSTHINQMQKHAT